MPRRVRFGAVVLLLSKCTDAFLPAASTLATFPRSAGTFCQLRTSRLSATAHAARLGFLRKVPAAGLLAVRGGGLRGLQSSADDSSAESSGVSDEVVAKVAQVRVATYNVLSSSLCEADYHTKCTPANLDPANRLRKVIEQLDVEVCPCFPVSRYFLCFPLARAVSPHPGWRQPRGKLMFSSVYSYTNATSRVASVGD
jgi:hypothetical protein